MMKPAIPVGRGRLIGDSYVVCLPSLAATDQHFGGVAGDSTIFYSHRLPDNASRRGEIEVATLEIGDG